MVSWPLEGPHRHFCGDCLGWIEHEHYAGKSSSRLDQLPFKLRRAAQHCQHQPSMWRRGIAPLIRRRADAHTRPGNCIKLSRSRVDLARRSRRVTSKKFPGPRVAIARPSVFLSVTAPQMRLASPIPIAFRPNSGCDGSGKIRSRHFPDQALLMPDSSAHNTTGKESVGTNQKN